MHSGGLLFVRKNSMIRRNKPQHKHIIMNKRKNIFGTYKTVLVVVLLLLAAVGLYTYLSNSSSEATITSFEECVAAGNPVMESYPRQCRAANGEVFVENLEEQQGQVAIRSGEVIEVDVSEAVVDGPLRVLFETEEGEELTVLVPSMGINVCPARDNILDVYELEAGEMIEVRGELSGGEITLCDSASNYLRR